MDPFPHTRQPDWDWWGRLWPAPGLILCDLGVTSGDSLVEVGSGNGYFALPAARLADTGWVYAVDVDQALLDELDDLAGLHGHDNLTTVQGDARALPDLIPDPVDVCLLANTFHGVERPGTLVTAMDDTLADDGRFIVINWHATPRSETTVLGEPRGPSTDLRMSPAETERRVTAEAPFLTARRVKLPPYHYAVVFRR